MAAPRPVSSPHLSVYLVPHTHWDREWYEPFQRFRLRLVDLLDDVLDRLAAEPRFRFTLDGQSAAIDDYLEIRPGRLAEVTSAVAAGRLAVGPWRILMDEFLCSGETTITNLTLGLRRAHELGGAMPVGYLPDQFGHIAQMPQLLRLAGIDRCCLWRGVPAAVRRHRFGWRSPDGTQIRCEYLVGGYGNAADVFGAAAPRTAGVGDAGARATAGRLADRLASLAGWYPDAPVLLMYGTDHAAPLPGLMRLVDTLRSYPGLPAVRVATLAEYLARPDSGGSDDTDADPVISGELRSHARAHILPGVLSVRWHLKEAMARAEDMTLRWAEPLSALWLRPGGRHHQSAQRYLLLAWQRLVDASGHDSVTGCGVDETAVQVQARLEEAEQLARAVRDLAMAHLAAAAPTGSHVVVNPTPRRRELLVSLPVAEGDDPRRIGVLRPDGTMLPTQPDGCRPGGAQEEPGSGPRRVLATVAVPAMGFTVVRLAPAPPGSGAGERAVRAEVTGRGVVLRSPALTVVVDAAGRLRVTGADGTVLDGVAALVDGGDAGDSYNYAPPVDDDLVDTPDRVDLTVVETGPERAVVDLHRRYLLPTHGDRWRRAPDRVAVATVLRIQLRRGEPFLRLALRVDNQARDHRLRLRVPLARPAGRSAAEGQFAVVERDGNPEGGPAGERPIATYPASGFVDAGGAAVLLRRTVEYELLERRELAITVVRSVGWLSRDEHRLRAEPAGPQLPIPAAQCQGPVRLELAVLPHQGDWSRARLVRHAEDYRTGAHTAAATGGTTTLVTGTGLRVGGDGVVCTRLHGLDGGVLLRLVAMSESATTAEVTGAFTAAYRQDLAGRRGAAVPVAAGTLRLRLRPWEIATLWLATVPPPPRPAPA